MFVVAEEGWHRAWMQILPRTSLFTAAVLLSSVAAGWAQQTEKSVAFVTPEKKYITAATGSLLDLSGAKIASKQTFTLVDLNGGDLADGDDVQVRYTPTPKPGEQPKPNFWREAKGELKRGGEAGTFKLKKVEKTFSFQTPAGKFVAAPASEGGPLTVADTADKALQVEIVDAPAAAAPKSSASPAAAKAADDAL
ncbi:MAG: hypothetical protein QOD99_723 [Chthoniobacter sp.]|nr:hypothetical protein [Chthoniobacter sp.]